MKDLRSAVGYLVVLISIVSPVVSKGGAQTRFEWPSSTIEVANYRYLEKCIAVGKRVGDSLTAVASFWKDSISWAEIPWDEPLHAERAGSVSRCIHKFEPATLPSDDLIIAHKLYLEAGLDEKAIIVAERIFSAGSEFDSLTFVWKMDSIVLSFIQAQPARIAEADTYYDRLMESGYERPWLVEAGINHVFMQHMQRVGDNAQVSKYASANLKLIKGLTAEQRREDVQDAISALTWMAVDVLNRNELLDSLFGNTAAYNELKVARFEEVAGRPMVGNITGVSAPTVHGDFWYPELTANDTWPKKGRVSLVYFSEYSLNTSVKELSDLALLRRLAAKFPDLDIITVVDVRGYFGRLEPQDRRPESEHVKNLYREVKRFPGIISITVPTVINIEPPDNRKVYQLGENWENYALPGREAANLGAVYLIDENGVYIGNFSLHNSVEDRIVQHIEVLTKRARGQ